MFGVTANKAVAPITTNVFSRPTGSFTDYANSHRATNPTTIATLMSMIAVLAVDALAGRVHTISRATPNLALTAGSATAGATAGASAGSGATTKTPGTIAGPRTVTSLISDGSGGVVSQGYGGQDMNVAYTSPPQMSTATTRFSGALFRPGAAVRILELTGAFTADSDDPTDEELTIRVTIMNIPNAGHWLMDLINAAKKKPLTEGNVEGYFASHGHGGTSAAPIAHLVNQIAVFYEDNVSDVGFRDLLDDTVWTTYRNSRVSAGQILGRLLTEFGDLGIINQNDVAAITASAAAPWDIALASHIRIELKAYASIFLETAGIGIDNWHQGNRAVDEMPAVRVRSAKAIFKRYFAIKNDVGRIDAAADVAALRGAHALW